MMENKNLEKKITLKIATAFVGLIFSLSSYLVIDGISGRKEIQMQKRQDGIIEAINQNPLTRISSPEEFRELYKKVEASYDKGMGIRSQNYNLIQSTSY